MILRMCGDGERSREVSGRGDSRREAGRVCTASAADGGLRFQVQPSSRSSGAYVESIASDTQSGECNKAPGRGLVTLHVVLCVVSCLV